MQPQKLCLKWNNHTTNLLAVLGSFQQKDILVDVTISCEGQNIKAHKMVLSACSPYFQSIFLENPCKHPVIIINGIKFEDITAILNFMYKGEVNVSQDGLSSFLQAAEALKVKGLAEVCGEKKSTNSMNQEVQQSEQNRPQRTDTPPRKRHRNRKRSLSDSNRSDDEGTARKHREHSSPEIHELSGDESFTGDNTSNGPPFNSVPRVPQNVYSRSHQSSSNLGGEEDEDFEVEPSKLLEQTLTTENVSMNNSNSDNNLRIERIMGNATEMESSSMQEPESPPDIKPVIDYGESGAGTSEGNLMLYSDQSQPGPSSVQDSLLHDSSHTQAFQQQILQILAGIRQEQRVFIENVNSKLMTGAKTKKRTLSKPAQKNCRVSKVASKNRALKDAPNNRRGPKIVTKDRVSKVVPNNRHNLKVVFKNRPISRIVTKRPHVLKAGASNHSNSIIHSENYPDSNAISNDFPDSRLWPSFPIDTTSAMTAFDECLSDKEFFNQSCKLFQSVGGRTPTETIKKILLSLMTNDLCTQYNWTGLRRKQSFGQLKNVVIFIMSCVHLNPGCKNTTEGEILQFLKKWLRHARDRDGSRKIIRKKIMKAKILKHKKKDNK